MDALPEKRDLPTSPPPAGGSTHKTHYDGVQETDEKNLHKETSLTSDSESIKGSTSNPLKNHPKDLASNEAKPVDEHLES